MSVLLYLFSVIMNSISVLQTVSTRRYIESNQIIKTKYQVFLIPNTFRYNIHIKITCNLGQSVTEMKALKTSFFPAHFIMNIFKCTDLGEGNGNPLRYSCLENPMVRRAWQATVHGVARVRHNLVTKPPTKRTEKLKE